jgi:hypothetical protein
MTTSELIGHCRRIAAVWDDYFTPYQLECHAHRRSGINPYSYRTTAGLYLQFYYGTPSRLWTPGGSWHFAGSMSYPPYTQEPAVQQFLARVDTALHEPQRSEHWGKVHIGLFGPVYRVLGVDGQRIEAPGEVIRFCKDGYREMVTEWADLRTGWDATAA